MGKRAGFTLLEMVIALMFGGILAGIAISGFGGTQGRLAVRSAQASFLSLHAHTRALAVERGVQVQLLVDPATDVVAIRLGCDGAGDILEARNFQDAHSVTVTTGGGTASLCMTPKGVANPSLNTFPQTPTRIVFTRGEATSEVTLQPLGQAVRR
jgi:prepilin-type N-terminal cleavage/methylation domain-containing protein